MNLDLGIPIVITFGWAVLALWLILKGRQPPKAEGGAY